MCVTVSSVLFLAWLCSVLLCLEVEEEMEDTLLWVCASAVRPRTGRQAGKRNEYCSI